MAIESSVVDRKENAVGLNALDVVVFDLEI